MWRGPRPTEAELADGTEGHWRGQPFRKGVMGGNKGWRGNAGEKSKREQYRQLAREGKLRPTLPERLRGTAEGRALQEKVMKERADKADAFQRKGKNEDKDKGTGKGGPAASASSSMASSSKGSSRPPWRLCFCMPLCCQNSLCLSSISVYLSV